MKNKSTMIQNPGTPNQNIWENISLQTYPLDGKGNPKYLKYNPISSVYKYPETFSDPETGEARDTLSLFSFKYKFRKSGSGIDSRLFPTWSSEKLINFYGNSLLKVIKNLYNNNLPVSDLIDYLADAIDEFSRGTKKSQLDYDILIDEIHCNYNHYPVDATYKNSSELGLGIINLYNRRLKSRFCDFLRKKLKAPVTGKLHDNILKDKLNNMTDEEIINSYIDLEKEISILKHIDNHSDDIKMNMEYLSFYGTAESSKKQIIMNNYQITSVEFRRKVQQTHHIILSDIIFKIFGTTKNEFNEEDVKKILKKISQYWLNKQE